MKVYIVTNFEGHWPVGTCAIVVARDRGQAKRLLNVVLEKRGLKPLEDGTEFKILNTSVAHADILNDGEY